MTRTEFHQVLVDILGKNNVYYQPPESLTIKYPCIIYKLDGVKTDKADNGLYLANDRMVVTLCHKDPDNTIRNELLKIPKCKFDRFYAKDNINHYVYTIYI